MPSTYVLNGQIFSQTLERKGGKRNRQLFHYQPRIERKKRRGEQTTIQILRKHEDEENYEENGTDTKNRYRQALKEGEKGKEVTHLETFIP